MGKRASVGDVIEGKYRLESELGSGGMGSVWHATQLMVDRPVAVKLLHPAFVDEDDLQARFEVEAKAIGRLNHPNVITLYDFGYSDDLRAFYTVIEYIDGESLDKRLSQRIPLTQVVEIIRQIALALDHAHHHGILHRDLKPENVMLASMTDGSEMVKVLDFGIARIVSGPNEPQTMESNRITKAGEVFGTPAYMSPEQARSIRQLEPSADLYSLGVMFYELVCGGLPFFAHSAFDLLMLHVTKPVPPIRRENVPPELESIIYKLLEKKPDARFQSGKELVDALDALELPEEEDVDVDDLDAGPTQVQQTPQPTLQTPVPAGVGDEGTNPEPPFPPSGEYVYDRSGEYSGEFAGPPAEPSAEHQRATMMLDSNVSGEFQPVETGSFASVDSNRGKMIGLAIAGLLGIVALATAGLAVLEEPTQEASAEEHQVDRTAPAVVEPETPEITEAKAEPRDIAAARQVTTGDGDPVKFPEDEQVDQKPKPEKESAEDDEPETVEKAKKKPKARPRTRRRPRRRAKPKTKGIDVPRIRATDDEEDESNSSLSVPRFNTSD